MAPLKPRTASSYSSTRALMRTATRAAAGFAWTGTERTMRRARSIRRTSDSSPHPAEDQLRVDRPSDTRSLQRARDSRAVLLELDARGATGSSAAPDHGQRAEGKRPTPSARYVGGGFR